MRPGRRVRLKLLARYPYCIHCGIRLSLEDSTIEHMIPKSRGGTDRIGNLALAHARCNEKRGSETKVFLNQPRVAAAIRARKEPQ